MGLTSERALASPNNCENVALKWNRPISGKISVPHTFIIQVHAAISYNFTQTVNIYKM